MAGTCITGAASAIMIGGFGAIFWIVLIGVLGLCVKFAESLLAIKYRTINDRGEICGGPMYYITHGLGKKKLGMCFALCGILVAFASGSFVIGHCISSDSKGLTGISVGCFGVILSLIIACALFGGIKRIAKVSTSIASVLILIYTAAAFIILASHLDSIPRAFYTIFLSAFSGKAAMGGALGLFIMAPLVQFALNWNMASHQLGMGVSSSLIAIAKTDMPARQALISLGGCFLSLMLTVITALVILVTQDPYFGLSMNSEWIVMQAFHSVFPFGDKSVVLVFLLLNLPSLFAWGYFGEKCIEFLCGERGILGFRVLFSFCAVISAFINIQDFFYPMTLFALFMSLMAIMNWIGLIQLAPIVLTETRSFFDVVEKEKRQRKSAELASE